MLYCEYCNYLKPLPKVSESSKDKSFICEYSNYIFTGNIEDLDIEYPCNSRCQMPETKN